MPKQRGLRGRETEGFGIEYVFVNARSFIKLTFAQWKKRGNEAGIVQLSPILVPRATRA